MTVDGITYKPKMIVITSSDLVPIFGVIQDIYITGTDIIHLVTKELHTIAFVNHFHAYSVSYINPAEFQTTRVSNLYDYHPLSLYIDSTSNIMYVPLKYHIVEQL